MMKKSKTIIKVEKWITRHGNTGSNWHGLSAKNTSNGKWLCEIKIPKIDIYVKTISKDKYKAISSAASKAYAVICEFLHCNLNASETFDSIRNMGIEIGENGEFKSTQLTKKQKERTTNAISWSKRTLKKN